jgi:hypothetical protein
VAWRPIDADPDCGFQSGPQHLAGFVQEGAVARVQQADDLTLGNIDAERPELSDQTRHRHLALMILQEHQAAQFRPKVASDPSRHRRRDRPAIRR